MIVFDGELSERAPSAFFSSGKFCMMNLFRSAVFSIFSITCIYLQFIHFKFEYTGFLNP